MGNNTEILSDSTIQLLDKYERDESESFRQLYIAVFIFFLLLFLGVGTVIFGPLLYGAVVIFFSILIFMAVGIDARLSIMATNQKKLLELQLEVIRAIKDMKS